MKIVLKNITKAFGVKTVIQLLLCKKIEKTLILK